MARDSPRTSRHATVTQQYIYRRGRLFTRSLRASLEVNLSAWHGLHLKRNEKKSAPLCAGNALSRVRRQPLLPLHVARYILPTTRVLCTKDTDDPTLLSPRPSSSSSA